MQKVKLFDSLDKGIMQIPAGSQKLVLVDSHRICLINYRNEFFGLSDLCPHMGHSLHQGGVNAFEEVVCPLHSYRFNLRSGEESLQRCANVAIYSVEVNPDGVYILV